VSLRSNFRGTLVCPTSSGRPDVDLWSDCRRPSRLYVANPSHELQGWVCPLKPSANRLRAPHAPAPPGLGLRWRAWSARAHVGILAGLLVGLVFATACGLSNRFASRPCDTAGTPFVASPMMQTGVPSPFLAPQGGSVGPQGAAPSPEQPDTEYGPCPLLADQLTQPPISAFSSAPHGILRSRGTSGCPEPDDGAVSGDGTTANDVAPNHVHRRGSTGPC
jgi:hypothetical protein